jgi:hypothetical protein
MAMAFPRVPRLPPDLEKEIFLCGYTLEMFTLRRLQYHYERDTRVYWNRILSPELPEETYYYNLNDTDHSVCEEIAYHLDNGDLEFAFLSASGPSVRCKFRKVITLSVYYPMSPHSDHTISGISGNHLPLRFPVSPKNNPNKCMQYTGL